MKALIITNLTRHFKEGNFLMIDVLRELGYEVHYASNFSQSDIKTDTAKLHHIDFVRNPMHIGNIKAYYQLKRLMKEEKFDLVWCNSPIGGLLGRICAKISNTVPVIYMAHGFHFYQGAPLLNHIVYGGVERMMARLTDGILTINDEDFSYAKKLKLRTGKAHYVHGMGVNTKTSNLDNLCKNQKLRELGIPKDSFVGIMVGELTNRKDAITGIRAISMVKKLDMHCIVCGKGPMEEVYKKEVKNLGLEDRVHFLGFRSDINELLACSDVYMFPTKQEGLPRSLMESMSVGLPSVVTRIRGNVDLIKDGENGFLFEVGNAEEMAKRIEELVDNPQLCHKMSGAAKETVKKFDIEVVREELIRIFNSYKNKSI